MSVGAVGKERTIHKRWRGCLFDGPSTRQNTRDDDDNKRREQPSPSRVVRTAHYPSTAVPLGAVGACGASSYC